jgi:lipopolysaccharide export system permease protein
VGQGRAELHQRALRSAGYALAGVRIFDFDEDAHLRSVTEAVAGEYVVPDGWRLTEVVQTVLHDERAEVEKLPEMRWQSALNPDILAVLMVSPDRMSLRHLSAYTKHLSENHQKTNRYDIAFWKKVIYPLAGIGHGRTCTAVCRCALQSRLVSASRSFPGS